jgi:hypothetical protein
VLEVSSPLQWLASAEAVDGVGEGELMPMTTVIVVAVGVGNTTVVIAGALVRVGQSRVC